MDTLGHLSLVWVPQWSQQCVGAEAVLLLSSGSLGGRRPGGRETGLVQTLPSIDNFCWGLGLPSSGLLGGDGGGVLPFLPPCPVALLLPEAHTLACTHHGQPRSRHFTGSCIDTQMVITPRLSPCGPASPASTCWV